MVNFVRPLFNLMQLELTLILNSTNLLKHDNEIFMHELSEYRIIKFERIFII